MAQIIREAVKTDCVQMMELIRELALFEKAPEEVSVELSHFEDSGFGDHPVWWALVAEDTNSGKLIGLALYYIRYSTWKGQRLYLEDLIVSEKYRGRGLGKQLFDALLIIAKKQGFRGMVWQALDWNEPALEFYKKYGARLDSEWVNCSLDF
ncbi:GNAT family N-acetyltransferase [Arachidicoccus ginsenosidivorans]|jgi:GNAT superfamily N-acetyltransferase|uniref:GNAT family N-acetyltransferase n=1 Tax=Arachidicoccus ginsenosidivorans TaxID=496057 RepID=A0A5B8VNH5_9BACT|nr:GNAT family N-acetyltransferase [Arachidicoccus ginsenosidivorans]QEC71808.1 GNAT family N-acetyltransferase [Arachidicoccus ginsenosidivorans]